MVPVVALTSVLGVRPWSATRGFQRSAAFTALGSWNEEFSVTAELVSAPLTRSGKQSGESGANR
jgi:hypothetical protein